MSPILLVPIDFSDCAPYVLDEASRLGRALGAGLLLLHAVEPPRGIRAEARVEVGGVGGGALDQLRREAERRLAGFVEAVGAAGVAAQARVEAGPTADVVLRVAAEARVRMIVMGTHGRQGVARLVLGSIAEEVLRRADVPVLTVRTRHRPTCSAASCATCSSDRTEVERALQAELDG